jgi:hypothetical protein
VADPDELYIAQVREPHEIDLLFSSAVVERAAHLLAGRADVTAQSSTEPVLVGLRGEAAPETARLQLVAGDFFGTLRQRAQIPPRTEQRLARSFSCPRLPPICRRGEQRNSIQWRHYGASELPLPTAPVNSPRLTP